MPIESVDTERVHPNAPAPVPEWVQEGGYVFDKYQGMLGRNVRVRARASHCFQVDGSPTTFHASDCGLGRRFNQRNEKIPEGLPCPACGLVRDASGDCHGCWRKIRDRAMNALAPGCGGHAEQVPMSKDMVCLVRVGVEPNTVPPRYVVDAGPDDRRAFDGPLSAAEYFATRVQELATGKPAHDPDHGRQLLVALAEGVDQVVRSRPWATREIDRILAEDAAREPKYATARRCAVLAAYEVIHRRPWDYTLPLPEVANRVLEELHRWERERGDSANPPLARYLRDRDRVPFPWAVVYERTRHLA